MKRTIASSTSSSGLGAPARVFLSTVAPLALALLSGCGGRVTPSSSVGAVDPPTTSDAAPDAEAHDGPTGDDAGPNSCAGSAGSYPLTGTEGHIEQIVVDACNVYWVSGVGANGQGMILRAVAKAGGPTRDLAHLPSWGPLLAQDATFLYATAEWSTSGSGAVREVGVLRIPKAGGAPATLVREAAPTGAIVGVAVVGRSLYYDHDAALHRLGLDDGSVDVVPTRGPGPLVATDHGVLLQHPTGVTRFDEALGAAEELVPSDPHLWIHGIAAAGEHVYLAADDALYDVFAGHVTALSDPGEYFSVAAFGDTVLFARNAALELGTYRGGVTSMVAHTGDLGNPTGLAIDPSGLYWSRNEALERSDGTPVP